MCVLLFDHCPFILTRTFLVFWLSRQVITFHCCLWQSADIAELLRLLSRVPYDSPSLSLSLCSLPFDEGWIVIVGWNISKKFYWHVLVLSCDFTWTSTLPYCPYWDPGLVLIDLYRPYCPVSGSLLSFHVTRTATFLSRQEVISSPVARWERAFIYVVRKSR